MCLRISAYITLYPLAVSLPKKIKSRNSKIQIWREKRKNKIKRENIQVRTRYFSLVLSLPLVGSFTLVQCKMPQCKNVDSRRPCSTFAFIKVVATVDRKSINQWMHRFFLPFAHTHTHAIHHERPSNTPPLSAGLLRQTDARDPS